MRIARRSATAAGGDGVTWRSDTGLDEVCRRDTAVQVHGRIQPRVSRNVIRRHLYIHDARKQLGMEFSDARQRHVRRKDVGSKGAQARMLPEAGDRVGELPRTVVPYPARTRHHHLR